MKNVEEKLAALGLSLPETAPAMALYAPIVVHAGIAYVSGQLPRDGNVVTVTGAVGRDISVEEARGGAKLAVLRGLAALKIELGSLNKVQRILKLSVYVQSAPDFTEQSQVADGASALIYDLFGASGIHARTAIGVAKLPKDAAVEVDFIVAVIV